MQKKFSYAEYKALLALPFHAKTERALALIERELETCNNPSVACSFGKDSMVLLHLVRQFTEPYVLFNNTGVQYKETYEYRDLIVKAWGIKLVETKPIMAFWTVVKKYGFPQFRKMRRKGLKKTSKTKDGFGNQGSPRCCYYLKEKPTRNYLKEYKIDTEFVGLQASESMVRRLSFLREGEVFNSKGYKCRIVRPIMIWTDEDIWRYYKEEKIPWNPLYDRARRNGCKTCTGYKGWRRRMASEDLKLYAHISRAMGQSLLADYGKPGCQGDNGYASPG